MYVVFILCLLSERLIAMLVCRYFFNPAWNSFPIYSPLEIDLVYSEPIKEALVTSNLFQSTEM